MLDRIAGFLVSKRAIVVAVMAALAVGCALLIPGVGVIRDMAEFLPTDSSMRAGVAIMDEEFKDSPNPSTIRVMSTSRSAADERALQEALGAIDGVDEVVHDPADGRYVKGEHSLYVVSTPHEYGSAEEMKVEADVEAVAAAHDALVRSDDPSPASELPLWIVLVAVALLSLILFAMCASWLEPVLFLVTVGVAVVLNLGTNIVRGSIADITFTIGAILQLVLSMDYSIILMNRFRQERAASPDEPASAMRRALVGAFSSIASSSMTTVVGLLTLCAMSITIGLDLGIVLAKGVFISMVCVFTVLPALVLFFDRAILATGKPFFEPRLHRLAAAEHRFRIPVVLAFIALFAGSAITSAGTPIAYTLSKHDPIADVFPTTNRMVLVYKNTDEGAAATLAANIETMDGVTRVASQPTTIGRQRSVAQMIEAIDELGEGGLSFDADALKLIYFVAHKGEATSAMTVADVVSFLRSDPLISKQLDPEMKSRLSQIDPYLDASALTTPTDAAGLASLLRIPAEDASDMLLMRAISDPSVEAAPMSLAETTSFIADELAPNPEYAAMLGPSALEQVRRVRVFTDADRMTSPVGYSETAGLFGLDERTAALAYAQVRAASGAYDGTSMPLPQYVATIQGVLASTPEAAEWVPAEQAGALGTLAQLTNTSFIDAQADAATLARTFSMPTESVTALLGAMAQSGTAPQSGAAPQSGVMPQSGAAPQSGAMPQSGAAPPPQVDPATLTASPWEFVDFINTALANPNSPIAAQFDAAARHQLASARTIMATAKSGASVSRDQFAAMTGMSPAQIAQILALADLPTVGASWTMTPQDFAAALASSSNVPDEQRSELARLTRIIDDSVAGRRHAPAELARLLSMSDSQARRLALLYTRAHGDTSSWNLSPQRAIGFIVDTMLVNPQTSGRFSADEAAKLRGLRTLIDASAEKTALTPERMTSIFTQLGGEIDRNQIALAYLAHAASKGGIAGQTLSFAQLIEVLATKISDDARFAPYIDDSSRAKISEAKSRISTASEQLVGNEWSRMIIETTLPVESAATSHFIDTVKSSCSAGFPSGCHLVGDSAMVSEMSRTFSSEMLLISGLTAAAIFLVVALTFFSLSVPALLVALVQCGVFITVTVIGLQGYSSYYLAQLMVQCILMGATIDYGILFTNQYREARRSLDVPGALARAYERSIHTILTSGSIMILVTGVLGYLFDNPTVGQICRTISMGAMAATVLILFILPGLLAALDRFVAGRGRLGAVKHNGATPSSVTRATSEIPALH